MVNETEYRGAIGSLLYLAICTRPDILFAVSKAARKAKEPTMKDWNNVMKILKYLKGTINFGLRFTRKKEIIAYVDADYAGDEETRRSTTGFIITMGGREHQLVGVLSFNTAFQPPLPNLNIIVSVNALNIVFGT